MPVFIERITNLIKAFYAAGLCPAVLLKFTKIDVNFIDFLGIVSYTMLKGGR